MTSSNIFYFFCFVRRAQKKNLEKEPRQNLEKVRTKSGKIWKKSENVRKKSKAELAFGEYKRKGKGMLDVRLNGSPSQGMPKGIRQRQVKSIPRVSVTRKRRLESANTGPELSDGY